MYIIQYFLFVILFLFSPGLHMHTAGTICSVSFSFILLSVQSCQYVLSDRLFSQYDLFSIIMLN